MRQFMGSNFIAAVAVALLAGNASALSTVHSLTGGALTGLGTDGNVNGNIVGDLEIGDRFEVAIELDNSTGDGIYGVFTHLKYDNQVINIVEGFSDGNALPPDGGFGSGNSLMVLAAPEVAAAQPAGTALGIAMAVGNPFAGDGVYTGPNSAVVTIAIFEVVGPGTTTIEHVDTGYTDLDNRFQPPTFSAPLQVVVSDADGDFVPDSLDNCIDVANGPNEGGLNQKDGDLDGYGNSCDGDYDQSGAANGGDFGVFIDAFNTFNDTVDLTGDGVANGADFGPLISLFNTVPGPSGLSCAGTIPCTP